MNRICNDGSIENISRWHLDRQTVDDCDVCRVVGLAGVADVGRPLVHFRHAVAERDQGYSIGRVHISK